MAQQENLTPIARSEVVPTSTIPEWLFDGLIDEMGPLPTSHFIATVVVTVVVHPLHDEPSPDSPSP